MRAHVSTLCALSVLGLACDRPSPAAIKPEPRAAPTRAAPERPAANPPAPRDDREDVLALVRTHNERPTPREFRRGHVTPRQLEASRIHRTENGFRVQLPSGAPVVTPTVHRGIVLTSGGFHSREVYAFRERTGELAWAISLDDDGPSVAACEDGVCVFNTESCTIFAVDVETGRMLWSWWLGDPLMSAPAIAGRLVYTSFPARGGPQGDSHVLAAFDLRTGEHRWGRWIDSDVMSAPVIQGERLYAASFAGTLYEFAPATGEILAAHRARATSAPVVANGELSYTRRTDQAGAGAREGVARHRGGREVVSSERSAAWLEGRVQRQSAYAVQGSALDTDNGFSGGAPASANARPAFDNVGRSSVSTLQAYQGSRMAHHGGSLYATFGDRIVSTDARTDRERWSVRLSGDLRNSGGALGASPAIAGDAVFVATLGGEVLEIDGRSGRVRHRYAVGGPVRSQPAIVGGFIYVGTENGQLVAIDTGNRSLTGWSTWGADAARTGTPGR